MLALSASPAWAAEGRIDELSPQPTGRLSVVFSAIGLAPGEQIDAASVKVRIDGQLVPSTAKPITSVDTAPVRTTMLVMDISGSMNEPTADRRTTRLAAAKSGAEAYLASVPKDVLVGLTTFSDNPVVAVKPTTDRATVRRAVQGLKANGGTRLYDAVVLATAALGTTGLRNQLLLSDGADDGSGKATLAQAAAAVAKAEIGLDAVSLGTEKAQVASLQTLAKAGGGAVVSTNDTAGLATAFEAAAKAQQTQVVIDVVVPSNVAGTSQEVVVEALAGVQTVGDRRVAILPDAATAVPTDVAESYGPVPVAATQPGITSATWFLPVAIGAVALGLFGLLAMAFLSTDRESQTTGRVRRRLNRYSLSSRPEQAASTVATSGALGQSQVARSAVDLAGRVVQRRDLDTGLGTKLEAAGVPLRPAEWLLIHVGIAIAAALVFMLLTNFNAIAAVIGLVLGLIVPYAYLAIKEERRKARFAEQLPETLQLLGGSLAAGYSLPQAIDVVVRESDGPMAVELNRALVEARLGVPMEDALETAAIRMDSVDFAWVVMAIRIQRQVGGNLAEVLNNVAATMRERERLRRQVQVLSAEGRLSAVILVGLPVVFVIYLVLVRPEYIGVLITEPLGIVLIVVGLILLVAGSFWLRKIVKVEV